MSIINPISRLVEYFRRHGFAATMSRAMLAGKRAFFASRMAVFYCDLDERKIRPVNMPVSFAVRRVNALTELDPNHLQQIADAWNPTLARKNIVERFEKGASLWLVESEKIVAGYGWTLRGNVIAPYYFPLGADDVQLFDFYVFPKFRGRAMHWLLTGYILRALAVEGCARAFADTGEWNKAQLAAFKMTPFRLLGMVKTYRLLGRSFSHWVSDTPPDLVQRQIADRRVKASA